MTAFAAGSKPPFSGSRPSVASSQSAAGLAVSKAKVRSSLSSRQQRHRRLFCLEPAAFNKVLHRALVRLGPAVRRLLAAHAHLRRFLPARSSRLCSCALCERQRSWLFPSGGGSVPRGPTLVQPARQLRSSLRARASRQHARQRRHQPRPAAQQRRRAAQRPHAAQRCRTRSASTTASEPASAAGAAQQQRSRSGALARELYRLLCGREARRDVIATSEAATPAAPFPSRIVRKKPYRAYLSPPCWPSAPNRACGFRFVDGASCRRSQATDCAALRRLPAAARGPAQRPAPSLRPSSGSRGAGQRRLLRCSRRERRNGGGPRQGWPAGRRAG